MSKSAIWPNFFIVGAPKAGTTSLYHYLRQHPQIFMSPAKEPYFFSKNFHRGVIKDEHRYLRLFKKAAGYPAVGEASPTYLRDDDSPFLIKERIPDARIIILLRDPVERAYSSYSMRVRNGQETRGFYTALQTSPFAKNYIDPGLYATSVKRYWRVFGKEQVMIVMFEELKNDPKAVTRRIAEFLGVSLGPVAGFDFEVHNPSRISRGKMASEFLKMGRYVPVPMRSIPRGLKQFAHRILSKPGKPPIDPRAVEFLRPIFEPDVKELEQLLERPLPELRKDW